MKPLYVSYRCLTRDRKDVTGCSVIEWDEPISTEEDIQSMKQAIIQQEVIPASDLTIYFWRRVE